MLVSEAIAQVKALTGSVVADAVYVRWLSEIDGRLAIEFYGADSWTPYDPTTDLSAELLVPFPWDGLYVHHLEAMTYYTNGEYDRSANARVMSEEVIDSFRKFMQRTHAPVNPDLIETNGGSATCVIGGDHKWFWLSAYSLAVKHGFQGTEEEWLASLVGGGGVFQPVIDGGTVTLGTTWSGSGPYTQTVTVTGAAVTQHSKVDLQPTAAQLAALLADGVTALVIENNAGTLTAYAIGAAASTSMTVQCTVTEVEA